MEKIFCVGIDKIYIAADVFVSLDYHGAIMDYHVCLDYQSF